MNKVVKIFKDIPDDELREAILELKESDDTGYIKTGGYVRKYLALYNEIAGISGTDIFSVTINLLKEGAYRWSDIKNMEDDSI